MIPTIHFILRIERPAQDGSVAVYIRITFNRKQIITLSIGKTIPLRKECQNLSVKQIKAMPSDERYALYYWDKEKERATKGFGNMESLNMFLDDEKKKANDILYDLRRRDKLSPDIFKKEYLGGVKNSISLCFLDYCLHELNKSRSEQYVDETKRSYKSIITKLNDYKPGILLSDITYKFLSEYENYMLKPLSEGGAGNNKRTVENNMKVIRTFVIIAYKNGDLKEYPFKDYKIKETEKYFSTRDFLEPDEIIELEKLYSNYIPPDKPMERLSVEKWQEREKKGLITPGEYKTLHGYLLGTYTGLRFRDIRRMTYEMHLKSKLITGTDKKSTIKYYIELDTHKTGVNVIVPLIDKAMKLLDINRQGKICDIISNQKVNEHLKSIQKKANLQKDLTFHVSRHSFATIAFEYGIPEKIVQSILGHRNRKFTEIYTHLSNKKLFLEMDKMNKGYNETELLLKQCNQEQDQNKLSLLSKLQNLEPAKLKKLEALLEVIY